MPAQRRIALEEGPFTFALKAQPVVAPFFFLFIQKEVHTEPPWIWPESTLTNYLMSKMTGYSQRVMWPDRLVRKII